MHFYRSIQKANQKVSIFYIEGNFNDETRSICGISILFWLTSSYTKWKLAAHPKSIPFDT